MGRFVFWVGAFLLFVSIGCGKKSTPSVAVVASKEAENVEGDDLPKLTEVIKRIKNKSSKQRMKGVAESTEIKNAETVAQLIEALNDPGCSALGEYYPDLAYSTREAAVMALLRQGPEGEKALLSTGLKTLQTGLKDADPAVREHTAYALALLGGKAKPAADDLIALCAAKEKEVRRAAYTALEKIRTVPAMPILQLLKNPEPEICRDAAEALSWLKPLPPEAVPVLIEVLKDEQLAEKDPAVAVYVRTTAAEAIGNFGIRAQEAIPALVEMVKKTNVDELNLTQRPRESGALLALRKIGKPSVPALIELLNDSNAVVRWQAVTVLGSMGPDAKDAIEPLQATVEKEFQRKGGELLIVADGALAQVRLGGDVSKAVAKITELLTDDRPRVRANAVHILGSIGRKAETAVGALIPLLDDPEETVRLETAKTLKLIGPGARTAIPALTKKLGDEDVQVRRAAILTLRGFGPLAAEAMPELTKLLADPADNIREAVLETLLVIGPAAKSATSELTKRLQSPSQKECLLAVEVLGTLGAEAKPAIPQLIALLSKDREIEEAVIDALGRIGPVEPSVVPALTGKLKSASRFSAVKALARMGPGAKSAAEDLKNFGKWKDSSESIWAAAAMARIGVDADANAAVVIQAMQKNKEGAKPALRKAALEAAEYLGAAGKAALPALLEALKEKDPISKSDDRPVRILAVVALGKLGPAAKETVPKLTDMLKESNQELKKTIIAALGNIGPDAKFAAARLREIARDEPALSDNANEALEKIEGKQ